MALVFDGTSFFTRNAVLLGAQDSQLGTLSFWFKVDSSLAGTERAGVIFGTSGVNTLFDVYLLEDAGTWKPTINIPTLVTDFLTIQASTGVSADVWHFAHFAWDGPNSTRFLAIDGVAVSTTGSIDNGQTVAYASADNWEFGGDLSGSYQEFPGKIKDFIWIDGTFDNTISNFFESGNLLNPRSDLDRLVNFGNSLRNQGTGTTFTNNGVKLDTECPPIRSDTAKRFTPEAAPNERWYRCDLCGWNFVQDDTTIDDRGRRVCVTGPRDLDRTNDEDNSLLLVRG